MPQTEEEFKKKVLTWKNFGNFLAVGQPLMAATFL